MISLSISNALSIFSTILVILGVLGALYAFFRGKKVETVRIQNETIIALQQQVDAIKAELSGLHTENSRLRQVIETIQSALARQGIHVTIDGEMVLITENEGTKRATRTTRTKLNNASVMSSSTKKLMKKSEIE